MVHKRYVKRGKKLHGPYYYQSYRDEEGKSRKRYLGKESKTFNNKNIILLIIGLSFLFLIILILIFSPISKGINPFGLIVSENGQNDLIGTNESESIAHINFVIELENAEHLDSNKNFISNIYDELKEQDDLWSVEIPDGDYVRVTFEQELDNQKDITIYPKVISGNPKIEVYEVDGTEIIVEFNSLNDDEYNKVYLTGLKGTQDTFDLKILGGSLEFDHIFDPSLEFRE